MMAVAIHARMAGDNMGMPMAVPVMFVQVVAMAVKPAVIVMAVSAEIVAELDDRGSRHMDDRSRRVINYGRRRCVHDNGRGAAADGDAEGKAGLGVISGGGQKAHNRHPGEYAGLVFHTYTYRRGLANRVQAFGNFGKLFAASTFE